MRGPDPRHPLVANETGVRSVRIAAGSSFILHSGDMILAISWQR